MGLRINTNVVSIAARNRLGKSQQEFEHAIKSLSSGERFVNAGDDAAGFAISENLKGHMQGLKQAEQNTSNAIGFLQVAEGGLNEQNNILIRLRELGVQAASDTVSDVERGYLDQEFQQLSKEFDRIAKTTTFGSRKLLTGETQDFSFQVGTNNTPDDRIQYRLDADTTGSKLGISGLSVSSSGDALDTLESVDSALKGIAAARSGFGSIQSRLQRAADNLSTQYENVAAAHSRYADVDVAEQAAILTKANVMQEMGMAVLAQANSTPNRASRLINML